MSLRDEINEAAEAMLALPSVGGRDSRLVWLSVAVDRLIDRVAPVPDGLTFADEGASVADAPVKRKPGRPKKEDGAS